jgi:hypothetical protein
MTNDKLRFLKGFSIAAMICGVVLLLLVGTPSSGFPLLEVAGSSTFSVGLLLFAIQLRIRYRAKLK